MNAIDLTVARIKLERVLSILEATETLTDHAEAFDQATTAALAELEAATSLLNGTRTTVLN